MIVQNEDDQKFFTDMIGIPGDRVALIRGAGVDIEVFHPVSPPPATTIRVALVGRMIWEKGIQEAVEAARLLKAQRDDIEIILVGDSDLESPSGVPEEDLRAWDEEGIITWLGRLEDMPALLEGCHVALLPSYREGFPKTLLEAAACGLPLIATDVTGCREICLDGTNGLLIPPRDPEAIAEAVAALADDPQRRMRFGQESRRLVEDHFSEKIVVEQTMELYRDMQQELQGS